MLSVWVNVAAAVAVLLVISFGSFMYFDASRQYQAKLDLVRNEAKQAEPSAGRPGSARPNSVEHGPQPKVITPEVGSVAKLPGSAPKSDRSRVSWPTTSRQGRFRSNRCPKSSRST